MLNQLKNLIDMEMKNFMITFDPIHNDYIALGNRAGKAFHDGLAMKDNN